MTQSFLTSISTPTQILKQFIAQFFFRSFSSSPSSPSTFLFCILLLTIISITSRAHEDHACELESITLTDDIELYPTFSPQQLDYYCVQRKHNTHISQFQDDGSEQLNINKIANDPVPDVVQIKASVHKEAAQRVHLLLIHHGEQPFDASITAPRDNAKGSSTESSLSSSASTSTLSVLKSKFIRNMKTMSTLVTDSSSGTVSTSIITQVPSKPNYYKVKHTIEDDLPSVIYEIKDNIFSPHLPIEHGNTTFAIQVSGDGAMNEGSPDKCQRIYTIHCDTTLLVPPMYAHIHGLLNQVIGVRVVPGEVYNLLSDYNVQMNGRFIYLASETESETSTSHTHSHPSVKSKDYKEHSDEYENFAYINELGIRTAAGARIEIRGGFKKHGFFHVLFNGHHMDVGDTQSLANIEDDRGYKPTASAFIRVNTKSHLSIQASSFAIDIINHDNYLELRTSLIDWEDVSSHGLIGQTWRRINKKASNPRFNELHSTDKYTWIEGDVTDYLVSSKSLFASSYKYHRFDSHNDE